jgi:hypothetical protein
MKKIFVLVIVILEIVTWCFPFGNVVLAENSCPDGNGWNSPTFPPGAEVRTGGNPFSIKICQCSHC